MYVNRLATWIERAIPFSDNPQGMLRDPYHNNLE